MGNIRPAKEEITIQIPVSSPQTPRDITGFVVDGRGHNPRQESPGGITREAMARFRMASLIMAEAKRAYFDVSHYDKNGAYVMRPISPDTPLHHPYHVAKTTPERSLALARYHVKHLGRQALEAAKTLPPRSLELLREARRPESS